MSPNLQPQTNGHLGISHPFGAPHGTQNSQTDRPRSTSSSNAHRLVAAQVSASAPLAERLYPDEEDPQTGLRYPHGTSSTANAEPLPPPKGSYYVLGKRPLGEGGERSTWLFENKDYFGHDQFFRSDGKNDVGFFPEGFQHDDPKLRGKYVYGLKKYDAVYIEKAVHQLVNEWKAVETTRQELIENDVLDEQTEIREYFLLTENCHMKREQVLERAAQLARADNKSLIIP